MFFGDCALRWVVAPRSAPIEARGLFPVLNGALAHRRTYYFCASREKRGGQTFRRVAVSPRGGAPGCEPRRTDQVRGGRRLNGPVPRASKRVTEGPLRHDRSGQLRRPFGTRAPRAEGRSSTPHELRLLSPRRYGSGARTTYSSAPSPENCGGTSFGQLADVHPGAPPSDDSTPRR